MLEGYQRMCKGVRWIWWCSQVSIALNFFINICTSCIKVLVHHSAHTRSVSRWFFACILSGSTHQPAIVGCSRWTTAIVSHSLGRRCIETFRPVGCGWSVLPWCSCASVLSWSWRLHVLLYSRCCCGGKLCFAKYLFGVTLPDIDFLKDTRSNVVDHFELKLALI